MLRGYALYPELGQVPYTVVPTDPQTDKSTAATVAAMQGCIRDAAGAPAVQAAAYQALGPVGLDAPAWRKCQAVWDWLHRHIQFVPDELILRRYYGLPEDVELLQRPELLLRSRMGDCDCFTMLACAMLSAVGVPAAIVTVKADRNEPWRWSHVYPIAIAEDGAAIPMDAITPVPYFGWELPSPIERKEWAS